MGAGQPANLKDLGGYLFPTAAFEALFRSDNLPFVIAEASIGIDRRRAKNDAMRDQVIVGPLGASALFGGSVENRIAYGIACD